MEATQQVNQWTFKGLDNYFVNFADQFELDSSIKASTLPNLGLIERIYDSVGNTEEDNLEPWERLTKHIKLLNANAPTNTQYKLLFITRHGLGYHNVFEAKVGKSAWNNHWSHLDGDGTVVWADSKLNEEGEKQIEDLGKFWVNLITHNKVPLPKAIYTSPLTRCLQTTKGVFGLVFAVNRKEFKPVVKELLRERLTDHTCDRRSDKSLITQNFPEYIVSSEMTENDSLWRSDESETEEDHRIRIQKLFEDIFTNDDNECLALVTHSYTISAIIEVLRMRKFRMKEGSCFSILVKAERSILPDI
jgi:broad specificity phosphatase PhoE